MVSDVMEHIAGNLTANDTHGNSTGSSEHHGEGHNFLPVVILFIFGSCALGAIARMIVHKISVLPYTVILLIFGLLLGLISREEAEIRKYTSSMTNMDPRIIFYVFLPVLVFESAYAMEAHTFLKSFWQIIVLAVFGLLFSIVITAYMCLSLFGQYGWNWPIALMFGSLISATDPVAVVALLKELGASKQLAILLEGESLLNDGTAIVAFDVFEKLSEGQDLTGLDIFLLFLLKAVAGPLFGYAMGNIAVFWLVNIFNDALTEITVTLAFTYITFFVGEGLFGSSGVLATVVLGVTLSNNRASVSPEVEVFLHRFWEVLAYLTNTLIFILVGTVITEQVASHIEATKIMLNVALYCVLTLIRSLMVLIFSPIITRIGYGLDVKNSTVIIWGGLRGAVGLALALIVRQNREIDPTGETQSEILVQTAGIVLLTLVVNATTIKPLLYVMGMSEISVPKRIAMASAVRNLRDVVTSTMVLYKTDRFLADADWDIVSKYTVVNDPYQTLDEEAAMDQLTSFERTSVCPQCHALVPNEPSKKEYQEMQEEARLRLLKAEKISYWRQFEHGILTREALQRLVELVDVAADRPPELTNTKEIEKTWKIRSTYSIMKEKLTKWQHSKEQKTQIAQPAQPWAQKVYRMCVSTAFEAAIYVIIFLNTATIIWQFAEESNLCQDEFTKKYGVLFDVFNAIFVFLYTIEAILKLIAFRSQYFSSKWNIFDFVVLLLTYFDLILDYGYLRRVDDGSCNKLNIGTILSPSIIRSAKVLRFLRLLRTMRLVKGALPGIIDYLDVQVNKKLRFAYDVGKGYVMAEEEVLHYLDHLVDNRKIADEYRIKLSEGRLEIIKGLGLLQKLHPGVAVSIKTQQATRRILNNVRDKVHEMRYEGILDDTEGEKLEINIEFQMKQLIKIPPSIHPPPPEKIIANLNWVRNDETLIEYIKHNAALETMSDGETLSAESDAKGGLYVIISGLVKIEKYDPKDQAFKDRSQSQTPEPQMDKKLEKKQSKRAESLHHLQPKKKSLKQHPIAETPSRKVDPNAKTADYLTTGAVLGEIALLTQKPANILVTCETSVQMYHISYDAIQSAIELFTDEPSLEYRLWRVCALRVASRLLHMQTKYLNWSKEKMKIFLEKAKVIIKKHSLPEGGKAIEFPHFYIDNSYVIDVVVVHGVVEDPLTGIILEGPVYVPQKVAELTLIPGKTDKHVILVTVRDTEIHLIPDAGQTGSMSTINRTSSTVLRPSSKHKVEVKDKYGNWTHESKTSLRKRVPKSKTSLESGNDYTEKELQSVVIHKKIASNKSDIPLQRDSLGNAIVMTKSSSQNNNANPMTNSTASPSPQESPRDAIPEAAHPVPGISQRSRPAAAEQEEVDLQKVIAAVKSNSSLDLFMDRPLPEMLNLDSQSTMNTTNTVVQPEKEKPARRGSKTKEK